MTGRGRPRGAKPSPLAFSLYDLITAIQDVMGPEDDQLVVSIVRHLLGAGRLTGRGARILLSTPQPEEKVLSRIVKDGVRQPSAAVCR
jgi:hypothetical protein